MIEYNGGKNWLFSMYTFGGKTLIDYHKVSKKRGGPLLATQPQLSKQSKKYKLLSALSICTCQTNNLSQCQCPTFENVNRLTSTFVLNQVTKKVVQAYLLPAIEILGLMGNFVGHNVVS